MNVINVIQPYFKGTWVFDDPDVGLQAEAFVAGADTFIDLVTAQIPDARKGFTMVFSGQPFPGAQFRLDWQGAEGNGNVYYSADLDHAGWLCPALLRYFDTPPRNIYVQIKPKDKAPEAKPLPPLDATFGTMDGFKNGPSKW